MFYQIAFAIALAVYSMSESLYYGINGDSWAYQRFVDEIRTIVKPEEFVFQEDLSGRLALLSGRRFVSGDGLVNSNEYLRRFLTTGRVGDYLAEKNIGYFLTSNIQCYPYRKRMPWTRDLEFNGYAYKITVDISYMTRMPIKPSILYFMPEDLLMDKCVNGIRELLFRVRPPYRTDNHRTGDGD